MADLVINEEEAKVVRYVHELFPSMLYRQVAVHLNEIAAQGKGILFPIKYANQKEKYRSPYRPWTDSDIRFIINNDLYVGRMQYAVNSKSPYLRGLEPVYTYREDLRILTDDVFERNQHIAAMRRRIPIQTKVSPHLFSGIMRCPLCGAVMAGRKLTEKRKTKIKERFAYTCSRYNRSGPTACPGYLMNEREVVNSVLPVLVDLIQSNLRDHLMKSSATNPLQVQMEGEIKAELAKVTQGMRNLIEAVKQGALSMEQVKDENSELFESKRRLEKRLNDLRENSKVSGEISVILKAFDRNLDAILAELMQNRLRFNSFIRIFFSSLVVEIDRQGCGWRKGKKKGELPDANGRIAKFTLEPRFGAFVAQRGIELPSSLGRAVSLYENLSESHGSPRMW